MENGKNIVEVKELTKFYGRNLAIEGISFTVKEGEILGFLGLNGAGKSTTLKILSCFLSPTSGTAFIAGNEIFENHVEIKKKIGYLPQEMPLYLEMTVEDYLNFCCQIKGYPAKETKSRIDKVSKETGIENVRHRIIGTLSHGYQKRVGIAQAMVHNPPILILDEPFSGLDPVQVVEMRTFLRSLKGNHTIIVSSHMLSEIHHTCDRILVIHEGKIIASDTEEKLSDNLSGSIRLDIEITGEKEKLVKLIKNTDYIINTSEILEDQGKLRFTITFEADKDHRSEFAKALVKKDFGLLKFVKARNELEEIFIQLTSRSEGR